MATRYLITGGGSVTWNAVNTAIWSATSGGATGASVPVDGDDVIMDAASGGGTVTLGYNPTVTSITGGAFTGTFDASTFSPTMDTFNFSGTATRTLSMGSGTWTLRGSGQTIWTTQVTTGLTFNTDTHTVNANYSGAVGTRSFIFGSATRLNLRISAGSDIIALGSSPACTNLDFTGFTGTYSTTATMSITGNLTLGTGMTVTSQTGVISFTGTSGTQIITSNGVALNRPTTFNGAGGTFQLADAFVTDQQITLTIGTFDANNFNVTCNIFSSSNSNVRTLTMGSGTWTLTGSNSTIWNTSTTTNLTYTANTAVVNFIYSGAVGTRRLICTSPVNLYDLRISAGSDDVRLDTATFGEINFTGFTGTMNSLSGDNSINRGNLIFGTGMTVSGITNNFIFTATSGTQTLTSNSVNIGRNIVINGVGTTVLLGDNLTQGVANSMTLSNGTFNANNKNISVGSFVSSNSNVRVLTMGSGTWTLTGTGTVWNTATITGLTFNAGTSTIVVNDSTASSKTLSMGALTYYDLLLTGGGTGTMIIGTSTDTKTFHGIRVDEPLTVQVFAGSTLVLTSTNFNVTGNGGQFNTFQSTSAGTPWTLSVASGNVVANYISLQDSVASGGATFYAGANSLDVSGNSGWIFTNEQGGGGQTAKIDDNGTRCMMAVSNADFETPVRVAVDGTTGALLVSAG